MQSHFCLTCEEDFFILLPKNDEEEYFCKDCIEKYSPKFCPTKKDCKNYIYEYLSSSHETCSLCEAMVCNECIGGTQICHDCRNK